jgi:hypothetical protein
MTGLHPKSSQKYRGQEGALRLPLQAVFTRACKGDKRSMCKHNRLGHKQASPEGRSSQASPEGDACTWGPHRQEEEVNTEPGGASD